MVLFISCDQGGELLYRMIQQVEQLLVLLNKVNFQDDRKKQQIQIVLKELSTDYLPMHLRKYASQPVSFVNQYLLGLW